MDENEKKTIVQMATMIEQMKWITKELHEIKLDVKNLNHFKWKAIGIATVCGSLAGIVIELFKKN